MCRSGHTVRKSSTKVGSMRRSRGRSSSMRSNAASRGPAGSVATALSMYERRNSKAVICSIPSPSPSWDRAGALLAEPTGTDKMASSICVACGVMRLSKHSAG